jgi:hypothetical protein
VIPLTDVLPRHVDAQWLPVGVALQLASQALRSRGWFNILRASYPDARGLRARHVMAASFAGAGVNGIVPARGGDLVRLAFVHRRIEGARYVTLAATALPETAFESLCSAALVAWLLLAGLIPAPSADHAREALLLLLVVAGAGIAIARQVSCRNRHLLNDAYRGLAMCSSPYRFVTQVASWQAVARLARVGSLLCFLAAFALPATLATALLVMAAQGSGRVVPIAPIGTGLRVMVLSCGFVAVSGQHPTPAALTAFTLATSALLLAVMLTIASVLIVHELGTRSPWRAVRHARERFSIRTEPRVGSGQPAGADVMPFVRRPDVRASTTHPV